MKYSIPVATFRQLFVTLWQDRLGVKGQVEEDIEEEEVEVYTLYICVAFALTSSHA